MRKSKSRKPPARRGNSKSGNTGNGKGHNSQAARADTIREVCHRVTGWEAERRAISAKITAEKQKRIKADLGMKIGDFSIALRLFQLEGDDRDQLLDTVRETFDALGVGEQLNWVDAAERAASATNEKVDEGAEAAAAARGPVGDQTAAPA